MSTIPPITIYGDERGRKPMTPAFPIVAGKIKHFYQTKLSALNPTPASQAEKVFLEATELDGDPESWDEAADVFIALMNWVFVNGGAPDNLLDAVNAKININLERTWEVKDGEIRHV